MAEPRGLPPGRAARSWVRRRLDTARGASSLLDRKLQVLRSEQARLRSEDAHAEQDWIDAVVRARKWLLRAAIVGGEREIRLAASEPALVELGRRAVMGVGCPTVERIAVPGSAGARALGTSALQPTASAYTEALAAAVRRAASSAALAAVDAEAARTAQRVHAINDRWIPRLEAARDAVGRRLDEAERDETIRLRWAAARHAATRRE